MKTQDTKSSFNKEALVFNIFLLLCVIALAVYASTWPYKPKLLPLGVCGITALLLLRQIAISVREKGETVIGRIPWKVIAGFAAFGAMILMAHWTGLVPAVGLLAASLSLIYGERRWWVIIAIGIAGSALMYFVFGQMFKIPMTF